MRSFLVSVGFTLSLCAGVLSESKAAINAFKRVEALESGLVEREVDLPYTRRLHKRASPYLTEATQNFVVNGTAIPDVDFDVGESFNGGPGCSSLSGLLYENGPFTWQPGTYRPTANPYTWVNLTNMRRRHPNESDPNISQLWVEQPVGVGYTQGVPNITNEVELGQEFAGFYKQFATTFGLENRKVYLTGESYAGFYVPYIADAFINQNDDVYYNLAGVAINDPILGDGTLQQEVTVVPYVDYWSNVFNLNASFTSAIHAKADQCNYTTYFNTYLTFPPPPAPFPVLPDPFATDAYTCDLFDDVYSAALAINPCFNIYHILDTCPHLWSQLGIVNSGDYFPPGASVYFNRSDVQAAINAPPNTNWMQCTNKNVFGGATNNQSLSDQSLGPAQDGVLQHVIEATNNTIIGVGNLDFLLPPNGTLMALQNVTWNGVQGFQSYPGNEFYTPYHPEYNGGSLAGAGYVGTWGAERGLTFYQVQLAGHELPQYTAGAAYRIIELLLGRISSLGEAGDFTTQTGNFTGSSTIYRV
ncbi:MAG: hypothetical protein LQ343_001813 [Gyalolechia ehrenbergii]|nr:MAG: hypothetical protein LQ343_001813 [Gyalolechia ehrenbergii]